MLLLLTACTSSTLAPVTVYGTSEGLGSGGVHNVVAGDTLFDISRRYKIGMQDIIIANSLNAPFKITVGQRLKTPPPRTYTVKAGDSLHAVARIFDVQVSQLTRLNDLRAPYVITPRQKLVLPSSIARAQPSRFAHRPSRAVAPTRKSPSKPKPRIVSKTPPRASGTFLTPVQGRVISRFGPKKGGLHNDGINYAAARGTPVAAAENGVVVYVGSELRGSGNLILIRHADRYMSAYAHLDDTAVKRGATVKRGAKIGTVGSTGSVDTPQLHFEIRRGTKAVNPQSYL